MSRFKKITAAVLTVISLALPMGGNLFASSAYAEGAQASASEEASSNTPSQADITAKYKKLGLVGFDQRRAEFGTEPSLTEPYSPGSLSAGSKKNSLALLNFIRYTAGLPEVKLDKRLVDQAQCTALLFAINGSQSYKPKRPEGISDEIYDAAMSGTGGRYSLAFMGGINLTMVKGFLADSGQYDITEVERRQQLLSPQLEKVGFGYADVFSVVQFGENADKQSTHDYIAWPPENMPMELYMPDFTSGRYAFSITPGSEYDQNSLKKAKITVTLVNTGKKWKISSGKKSKNTVFYVDKDADEPGCIIFDTGYTYSSGDIVRVEITGLTKGGVPADISYDVNFFTMCPDIADCEFQEIPDCTYTGKKITPALNITFDGEKLVKGRDYTVKYSRNRSAGTAVAEIKGKGRFSGDHTFFFNIVPKKQKIKAISGGAEDFTVSWTPDKQAAFYEVQYSLNKDMSGARTITSAAVCECTMRCWLGVKPGSRYYVRVRSGIFSLGKIACGPWTGIQSVMVG